MNSTLERLTRDIVLFATALMLAVAGMTYAMEQEAWAAQGVANGETQLRAAQNAGGLSLEAQETKSISDVSIPYIWSQDYTGFPVKPALEIEDYETDKMLVEGVDYTASYSNNVNVGTAKVTITGKGAYSGTTTETFKITSAYMGDVNASVVSSVPYTGKAQKPKPVLTLGAYTLQEDKDYVLSYSDNVDAGTADITATAIGNNFDGLKFITFTIKPVPISKATLRIANQYYNGYELTPDLSKAVFNGKKLKEYSDYKVAFKNNEKPGTATAIVTGEGNFKNTKKITFKIKKQPLAKAKVSGVANATYTGKSIKQYLTVSVAGHYLEEGVDYKVAYKNNKNAGKATVIVTGKGGYTGSKKASFKIKKAANPMYAFSYYDLALLSKVKKAAQVLDPIGVYGAKGAVTYAKKSGSSNLSVDKKTGKVTLKKGSKRGTYKMKVTIKAVGNKNYKSAKKTITAEVQVI